MAKTIAPSFSETPLEDVAVFLEKALGFPVELDHKALANIGIGVDTPVTFRGEKRSVKQALNMMLRDLGLEMIVKEGMLVITSPEEAEKALEARVYDVTDLVSSEDGSPDANPAFDQLKRVLTEVIAPQTWTDVGGPGAVEPFAAVGIQVLVVSQTQSVHLEIADLLQQLRSHRHGPPPGGNDGRVPQDPAPAGTKPAAAPATSDRQSAAEQAIRNALDKRLTVEFREKPLREVVRGLEKAAEVAVVLDKVLFRETGPVLAHEVGNRRPDEPLTFVFQQMTLRAALDQLCDEQELAWTVAQGSIVITEPNSLPFENRVYDVADLPVYRNERGEGVPDYAALTSLITHGIAPDTWSQVGGPGSLEAVQTAHVQTLAVSQTWKIHEEIAALLTKLRNQRKRPVTTEDIAKLPVAPPPRQTRDSGFLGSDELEARGIYCKPAPLPPDAQREALVQGNNQFACDLYQQLRDKSNDNLFFSPGSLSTALAMAYAGARGPTAQEMARTMHFALPPDETAAAFQSLWAVLPGADPRRTQLFMANRLWGQKDYPFRESFLTTSRERFGAELAPVDFTEPATVCRQINGWAAEKTAGRIREVFQPQAIEKDFRLVLTNAVYFQDRWLMPFEKQLTQPASFHVGDQSIRVAMMHQKAFCGYAEHDGLQILEKLYRGGEMSLLILLPDPGADRLDALERLLSAEQVGAWVSKIQQTEVKIYLPRFDLETSYQLKDALAALGMRRAFSPTEADLSGMHAGPAPLWLAVVAHRAMVKVGEEGTVAAAVTSMGGMGGMVAPPPRIPIFLADHPFVFLIRDCRTGSILFLGRLTKPAEAADAAFGPYQLPLDAGQAPNAKMTPPRNPGAERGPR